MWKRVLLGIIFLIVLGGAFAYFYFPTWAENKLQKTISVGDSLSFDDLKLDLENGHISFQNIYFLHTARPQKINRILFTAEEVNIKYIALKKLVFLKKWEAQNLEIRNGNLQLVLADSAASAEYPKQNKSDLKSVNFKHILIENIATKVRFNKKDTSVRMAANFHFSLENLALDLKHKHKPQFENVWLNLEQVYFQNNDGISQYFINQITFAEEARKLSFKDIRIAQRKSPINYARHFNSDKVHFEITADSAIFNKMRPAIHLIDSIKISDADIFAPRAQLFKDKRFPHKTHRRKFPFEAIAQIPLPLHIDSLRLHNGELNFMSLTRNDGRYSELEVSDISVVFNNISSTGPTPFGQFSEMRGSLKFYRKLPLQFSWKFDLNRSGKAYIFDGYFGKAPLATFNPFLKNSANFLFEQGNFLGGRLLVEGNTKDGEGKVDFYFDNMKIVMINDETRERGLREKLIGGTANLLMKNRNLPDKNPRAGVAFSEVVQDRFIVHNLWLLYLSGIKDVLMPTQNLSNAQKRRNEYISE